MTITATGAGFDAGRVLGRGFATVRRRWLALTVLSLTLGWLPRALLIVAPLPRITQGVHNTAAFAVYFAETLALLLLAEVLHNAIVKTSLAPADERPSIAGAVLAALRAAPTLLAFWLVANAGIFVRLWILWREDSEPTAVAALLGLLGPGSFLFEALLALFVAMLTPVVLAEGKGLLVAIARSAALMGGGRWKFLGLYLLMRIAVAIPGRISAVALMVGLQMLGPSNWRGFNDVAGLILNLVTLAVAAVWGAILAAAYRELCRIHDGLAPGEVAEIFA
ncbi:MAG: hypothetical protein ACHP7N_02755 [Caulobacterales bacterium]